MDTVNHINTMSTETRIHCPHIIHKRDQTYNEKIPVYIDPRNIVTLLLLRRKPRLNVTGLSDFRSENPSAYTYKPKLWYRPTIWRGKSDILHM